MSQLAAMEPPCLGLSAMQVMIQCKPQANKRLNMTCWESGLQTVAYNMQAAWGNCGSCCWDGQHATAADLWPTCQRHSGDHITKTESPFLITQRQ